MAMPSEMTPPAPEMTPDPMPQPSAPPSQPPVVGNPSPMVSATFTDSNVELINPERGFYIGLNLLRTGAAAAVRSAGHSVAIAEIRLDDYRDSALPASLLTTIENGFVETRAAGVKVILRFMYNASFTADASKSRILGHITQLTPILQRNADVIAVMQAGFIGAWGEWHGSTNGLDNDTDRSQILAAILAALPANRSVQVRTPMFKAAAYGSAALTAAQAFTNTDKARVGHHNDCFLASDSDYGTYASPVANWRSYVAQETLYTPMGGETCAVYASRTDCTPAMAEMAANHWSYLNLQYHQSVLAGWETQGCASTIRRKLGYRFALQSVSHNESVAPGGELALMAKIANSGYAAPFNKRPVFVVLTSGSTRRFVALRDVDARRWAPGQTADLMVKLRVPADLPAGNYSVGFWLPDDATTLRSDPRYSIRLANGVWNAITGDNVATTTLRVDPSVGGAVDTAARDLVQL